MAHRDLSTFFDSIKTRYDTLRTCVALSRYVQTAGSMGVKFYLYIQTFLPRMFVLNTSDTWH